MVLDIHVSILFIKELDKKKQQKTEEIMGVFSLFCFVFERLLRVLCEVS